FGMRDERGFDFHGAEAMATHVDDVVDAAHEPEVAVGVLARAVAGGVATWNVGPVGLLEALIVAVDRASHRRPGLANDKQAARAGGNSFKVAVGVRACDHFRLYAEERARGRAG